jgi:glycolate oxidase FAD binding subunit
LTTERPSEEELFWSCPERPTPAPAEDVARFAEAARRIVSDEHVRPAGAGDEVALIRPQVVVRPADEREVASIVKLANDMRLAVIPRGGGTKNSWGNEPSGADVVVSLERLNQIEEHAWADLTVTVQAGCTVRDLQQALARHGQRLALDALWSERATVGGVLSTNDSGALRLRFGGLRDLVIGVTLALADGTLAKSGGKVVKNVAGYDLPKLVTGAFGTLGVITRAVFRLHPMPRASRTISIACGDLQEAQRVMLSVQDSTLAHSAMQMRCGTGVGPEVDVLFEGPSAGVAAQVASVKTLLPSAKIADGDAEVWTARQKLFDTAKRNDKVCNVAKLCVPPARIAEDIGAIERLADSYADRPRYEAVMQATGIGCVAAWGDDSSVADIFYSVHPRILHAGGSMMDQFRISRGRGNRMLSVWRVVPDARMHALMQAVKRQFDPHGTLNPGRFAY